LAYPDFNKDFILDTDASHNTIGAVLSQLDDEGNEKVIAYGSHAMSKHEIGYCITRKELLAIYFFTQHFKHYLYGRQFTLRTDHKAITYMMTTKKPITSQFQTWLNFLSSLDMKLEYRKGLHHSNADALSRRDCDMCGQCQMQHEEAKKGKLKTKILATLSVSDVIRWQQDSREIEEIKRRINDFEIDEYMLKEGVIMTRDEKIWIPDNKRDKFIQHIHLLLCHAGMEKILNYIEDIYAMKDIKKKVKEIIETCEGCQKRKVLTTRTKEVIIKQQCNNPFESIFIDFCGPLKTNRYGKKYILGIIDQFSRYVSLTAITKQDEETTSKTILNNWILKFGAPRLIHVDRGRTFESKLIRTMCEKFQIKLEFSSPYHHNTNGIIERQFRTIRDYINTTVETNRSKNWVDILPEIEFCLNATVQKSLKMSPAEIVFGFKINREWGGTDRTNNRDERIKTAIKNQKLVNYHNENRGNRHFEINEEVLVKKEGRVKDDNRYEGPYRVTKKIHDRSYELENNTGKKIIRNIEWLRSFKKGGC